MERGSPFSARSEPPAPALLRSIEAHPVRDTLHPDPPSDSLRPLHCFFWILAFLRGECVELSPATFSGFRPSRALVSPFSAPISLCSLLPDISPQQPQTFSRPFPPQRWPRPPQLGAAPALPSSHNALSSSLINTLLINALAAKSRALEELCGTPWLRGAGQRWLVLPFAFRAGIQGTMTPRERCSVPAHTYTKGREGKQGARLTEPFKSFPAVCSAPHWHALCHVYRSSERGKKKKINKLHSKFLKENPIDGQ